MERYLHFPHTRVMLGGEPRRWEMARKYLEDFQSRLEEDSWHCTELVSIYTEIITKKKCHTRIRFKRFRRDGSIISKYQSLYVTTEKNKSWGIPFGSGTGLLSGFKIRLPQFCLIRVIMRTLCSMAMAFEYS